MEEAGPHELGLLISPLRTSLGVRWLRLCTSTAGGTGLILGQGTKILHATWHGQKIKKKKDKKKKSLVLSRKHGLPPHPTLPHPHLIPILVKPCHPLPPLHLGGWPISCPAYTTLPKSSMCLLH